MEFSIAFERTWTTRGTIPQIQLTFNHYNMRRGRKRLTIAFGVFPFRLAINNRWVTKG